MQTTVKRVGAWIWKHLHLWVPPVAGAVYFVLWGRLLREQERV
jgi:hypothetical protein